jgi:dihydroorotase
MADAILIKGGRTLDPATGLDVVRDLYIENGLVAPVPASLSPQVRVIDAAGMLVAPGFIDLHVHLREPGGDEAETIETGSRAAARGGFTTIVAMPNTRPPYDTPERVAFVKRRGDEVGLVRVLPSGAITQERKGKVVNDLRALREAGAVAVTDDGSTVQDDAVMEEAMRKAREAGLPLMDHAQDNLIERQGGVMHEGEYSRKFGLPGIPSLAEESIIRRDIELAAKTGCRLHIQHVTSKEGVALIRDARRRGLDVTGELTPHHLTLTDADIDPEQANYKMNPPLRSEIDRAALLDGILDGTFTCYATDHAPHSAEKKALGFLKGPFGIVGLETAIGITYSALVQNKIMDAMAWVRRWTSGPASVLGLPAPTLQVGAVADVVVIDVASTWTVRAAEFATRSRNTPFEGWHLNGRAAATICGGRVTWGGCRASR